MSRKNGPRNPTKSNWLNHSEAAGTVRSKILDEPRANPSGGPARGTQNISGTGPNHDKGDLGSWLALSLVPLTCPDCYPVTSITAARINKTFTLLRLWSPGEQEEGTE
jgi:hypothetical protein